MLAQRLPTTCGSEKPRLYYARQRTAKITISKCIGLGDLFREQGGTMPCLPDKFLAKLQKKPAHPRSTAHVS